MADQDLRSEFTKRLCVYEQPFLRLYDSLLASAFSRTDELERKALCAMPLSAAHAATSWRPHATGERTDASETVVSVPFAARTSRRREEASEHLLFWLSISLWQ